MEEELEMQIPLEFEEALDKDDDLDVYTEEGIDEFVDDDSISASEQGFMSGYLGA